MLHNYTTITYNNWRSVLLSLILVWSMIFEKEDDGRITYEIRNGICKFDVFLVHEPETDCRFNDN